MLKSWKLYQSYDYERCGIFPGVVVAQVTEVAKLYENEDKRGPAVYNGAVKEIFETWKKKSEEPLDDHHIPHLTRDRVRVRLQQLIMSRPIPFSSKDSQSWVRQHAGEYKLEQSYF